MPAGDGVKRMRKRFDVIVVGPGPVGLAAALGLARAGCRTALVGPEPARRDGRTAALLAPSVELLRGLGLWATLGPEAGALRSLRIVDDTGSLFRPPPVTFAAAEIGLEAFGWNVVDARLTEVLAAAARREAGLDWLTSPVDDVSVDDDAVTVRLADGRGAEAALLVGADGRRSRVREAAGIRTTEHRYRQAAFTTLLEHERDHEDCSTEFHTRAGPFTLVPLPGRRSSLVWVTEPHHAKRLSAASEADLAAAIERRSHHLLGRVRVAGPRGTVPLAVMSAAALTARRIALAGEAAHVLPPTGAQGLNLGFADVRSLVRLAEEAARDGRDPGSDEALAGYARDRAADTRIRTLAVDGLNRALVAEFLPLDMARGIGLGLLGAIGPLRRAVMRAGFPGGSGARPLSSGTGSAAPSRS